MFSPFPIWCRKNLLGPLGGFVAILGFILPFNAGHSLFSLMDGTTLPFLPQTILLTIVATIILYDLDFTVVPTFFSTLLFGFMCLYYWCLFSQFSFRVVIANMQIGMYVIPVGLLGMFLHPFGSDYLSAEP